MGPSSGEVAVRDAPERRRYEITVDGELAGFSTYRREPSTITFVHTVIDPAFGGRGLGSSLARHVLDEARAAGLRVKPVCPFIAKYIADHAEYQDLVRGPRQAD